MAALSKRSYDYVAHVQRNGQTVELAGTKEDYSMKKVYQFLLEKATEIGGWLLTQHITESEPDATQSNLPVVRTSQEIVEPKHTPTFGSPGVFGEYSSDYPGATRLTFTKEK